MRFNDSPTLASGYFSYHDATQMVANWNVHVPTANFLPAYTYLPSNSSMSVSQSAGAVAPTLVLSAATDAAGLMRQLQITPLAALDVSNATVSLDSLSSVSQCARME